MKLNNFKDFNRINEAEDHYSNRKVKDWHAAEDHLEKEGVLWTDLDRNHPDGVGFNRDGKTVAHYDKHDGHVYLHEDPAEGWEEGEDAVSTMDDGISDKSKSDDAYYKKDGLGDGSDFAAGEVDAEDEEAYRHAKGFDDEGWSNDEEEGMGLDDIPFYADV